MASCSTSTTKDASQEEVGKEGRDWSSLSEHLLGFILGQFTCLREFFACRRVCRRWRSIAVPRARSMSSQSPLLLVFHPDAPGEGPTKTFYDIAEVRPYKLLPLLDRVLGYSHGHLIRHGNSGAVICNLFNGAEIPLPDGIVYREIHRIFLSSSPSSPDCLVVCFTLPELCELDEPQEIHYCRIGSEHPEWKLFASKELIMDVVFFKDMLYVLNARMQLGVLDPHSDPWELRLLEADRYQVTCPGTFESHPRWILAECGGNLLKLAKGEVRLIDDGVMRWESNGDKWVRESDLDGRSLFVGKKGFGGSAFIRERSGLRQNCIYYAHHLGTWSGYTLQGTHALGDISIARLSGFQHSSQTICWVLPSFL